MNVQVTLTAQNLLFDTKTIAVPAGSTVTMTFINKDSGTPHNFAFYIDSSAPEGDVRHVCCDLRKISPFSLRRGEFQPAYCTIFWQAEK